jgi:hypothetical protein
MTLATSASRVNYNPNTFRVQATVAMIINCDHNLCIVQATRLKLCLDWQSDDAKTQSFFPFRQLSLSRKARPIDLARSCMSLEEVTVHACHKVLMDVDDNSVPIDCYLLGILGRQPRPHPNLL